MKILYVAMASSIHVARFLNQVNDLNWDLHLFSSAYGWEPHHPLLRNVTMHGCLQWPRPKSAHPSVRQVGYWPIAHKSTVIKFAIKFIASRWFPDRTSPAWTLAQLIKTLKPDVIHSHEIQHAGYLMVDALKYLDGKAPPWIVTNWGSDIYYFGRLQKHEPLIRSVLEKCDYYTCECERDVQLGRKFGFAGEVLRPVMANPGGFHFDELDQLRTPGPVAGRRVILLKGYQGIFGRVLTGLVALEMCKELLRDYEILVYSGEEEAVANAVEMLAQSTGLKIRVLPRTEDYNAIMRLRGQARVSIGLSISDAASISFLETLAMGSFPIQSDRGSSNEWIRNGETGLIVPPDDPTAVANALRIALTDDDLVNRAGEINMATARERLDFHKLKVHVRNWYESIVAKNHAPSKIYAPRRVA
jgi:glycosyltransferase involved in cell wall biosynthesis